MDNFTVIYRILKILENAMDCSEPDLGVISAEKLGISSTRLSNLLEMMADDGYIKGLTVSKTIAGKSICTDNIRITIRGLEYLNENTFMKKAYNAARGISALLP